MPGKIKEDRKFSKAVKIANVCADEHIFSEQPQYDCDFCPFRKFCVQFWDDYVIDLKDPSIKLKNVIGMFKTYHELKESTQQGYLKEVGEGKLKGLIQVLQRFKNERRQTHGNRKN